MKKKLPGNKEVKQIRAACQFRLHWRGGYIILMHTVKILKVEGHFKCAF